MPYVNDSSDESVTGSLQSSGFEPLPRPVSRHRRYQYGWRSSGEVQASNAEVRALSKKNLHWSDTATLIESLERAERALYSPVVRNSLYRTQVWERKYMEGSSSNLLSPTFTSTTPDRRQSQIDFTPLSAYTIENYPLMGDSSIRSYGAEMIRQSRPTMPHASLGQWLGELRGGKGLVRAGLDFNLSKTAAQGYLNWQFGWKPFIADIRAVCESIVKSEGIVNQFLSDSSEIVHRTRVKQLDRVVEQTNVLLVGSSSTPSNPYPINGKVFEVAGVPISLGFYSGHSTVVRGDLRATVTVTEQLRSFADFEYFVADPDGSLSRLQRAVQIAKQVLGSNLDPSLFYELAPYSWLVDWYYDLGGLLAFQVSVQDDSLAARRCGTTWERLVDYTLSVQLYNRTTLAVYLPHGSWIIPASMKMQRRLPGSPYDMGTTWATTPQQWAILAALGLTRAPGVGIRL